jgi:hypothetical protein
MGICDTLRVLAGYIPHSSIDCTIADDTAFYLEIDSIALIEQLFRLLRTREQRLTSGKWKVKILFQALYHTMDRE